MAICYFAAARRPIPHCDYRRAPAPPSKSGNSSPLTEEKKEVINTTTRTLQGVTYPAYPSLRNTAEAQGEKNLKTPTIGAQVIETQTKNNSRCIHLNTEGNIKTTSLH
jgi:hypothetical protein